MLTRLIEEFITIGIFMIVFGIMLFPLFLIIGI